jgi:hypothetical protein
MLIKISINPDGMEQLLRRGENNLYSWNLSITMPGAEDIPNGNILLREVEIIMPPPEQMVPIIMDKLRKRETEIQVEAHEEMMRVKERRNDILMLTTNANVA